MPFIAGIGTDFSMSDPVFRAKFEAETGSKVEEDPLAAARVWTQRIFGQNHTWEELAFIRKNWDGPLILKGIQHVDDARAALKHGCDGIVVSNHGGKVIIRLRRYS